MRIISVVMAGVLMLGCGSAERERQQDRADKPTIDSVTIENSSALNYNALSGSTVTCRATMHSEGGGAIDANAAFVVGSITRTVPMTNGAAQLVLTSDMTAVSNSASCVVSASVRDSGTVVRQSSNTVMVGGYNTTGYTYNAGYNYNRCSSTYVNVFGIAVASQRCN